MLHILHAAMLPCIYTLYLSVFLPETDLFTFTNVEDAAIFVALPVMHLPMCAVSAIIHEKLK